MHFKNFKNVILMHQQPMGGCVVKGNCALDVCSRISHGHAAINEKKCFRNPPFFSIFSWPHFYRAFFPIETFLNHLKVVFSPGQSCFSPTGWRGETGKVRNFLVITSVFICPVFSGIRPDHVWPRDRRKPKKRCRLSIWSSYLCRDVCAY